LSDGSRHLNIKYPKTILPYKNTIFSNEKSLECSNFSGNQGMPKSE